MRGCVLFIIVFAGSVFEGIMNCSYSRVNAAKIQHQNQAMAHVDIYTIKEHIGINKNKRSVKPRYSNSHDGRVDMGLPGYFNSSIKKFPPKFKYPSKMFKMDMKPTGSSIRLKCSSIGNPVPNITWYKNNGSIVRLQPPIFGKWAMLLEDLMRTDEGEYTCFVCNELGCITHSVELKVQERYPSKPYIKKGYPGNITAAVNEMVQMSCPPYSDLEPYLYWMKAYDNFTSISLEVGTDVIPDGRIIESEEVEDKPETLTIRNVTYENQGWYICVAMNTLGYDVAKGYLTVIDPSLEETHPDPGRIFKFLILPSISFIVVLLISTITAITIIMSNLRKEKRRKTQAVERMRVMLEEHWAKIVTVDYNTNSNDAGLVTPSVSIEKIRYCDLPQDISKTSLSSEYILPVDTKWEIAKESLSLDKVLGEGEFGKVYRAELIQTSSTGLPYTVAVKTLKEGYSDTDVIALVSEMEIMKLVGKHENVIKLLGCCTQEGQIYVVVEYAHHGCLRDYLKRHKPHKKNASTENLLNKSPTQKELTDFVWQVAKGMSYLVSRGCIHRDLAARNVLVSSDKVLKVADFGFARDVRDSNYYRKRSAGKLPVRWMAPESLCHNYYTTKSDMWSFGVLAWEIMTFASTPYRDVNVHCLYQYLKSGNRMERPHECSKDVYAIMMHCWTFHPDDRPRFTDLVERLQIILKQY